MDEQIIAEKLKRLQRLLNAAQRQFIKAVYQRPVDTFDLSLRTSRHRVLVTL